MKTTRTSRHLLERPRRTARRSSLLGVAGLVTGTLLLALIGTGGSFALWRGSTSVQAAPLSAAKVAVTHTGFTPLTFTYKTGALTTTSGVQISNTGDVAGAYSSAVSLAAGSSASLASAITVLVWDSPSLASCTTSASAAGAASYKWNSIPAATGTLAAGASQVYCLRTSIPSGSLGITGTVTPTLTTTLTVGSAWKATATSTATQQNQVVADKTAPTAPGTPVASGTTATSTVLTWAASTDAVGVVAYDVYRNGVLVASVASPGYTDTALAASTTYSYTVKARDAANNASAASGSRSVTTTAPTAPAANTWYQVINPNSGKCLDAQNVGTANGTVLQQWSCGTAQHQQWQFRATSDGYYEVVPRHAQALAWDVDIDAPNSANGTADGAPVQLWTYGGGANQQWQAVPLGDGTYHFVVKSSGKCLDVRDVSKADGGVLQQWACGASAAQVFRLVPVS